MLSIIYMESKYKMKINTDWIKKSKIAMTMPSERKKWNSEKIMAMPIIRAKRCIVSAGIFEG